MLRFTGDPNSLLSFTEFQAFTRAWEGMGLKIGDLCDLQEQLKRTPDVGSVVKKSHRIRKMRFSPRNWETGKSGAVRVLYVLFPNFGTVALAYCYPKSTTDNISDRVLQYLNQLVEAFEIELGEQRKRRQKQRRK